MIKNYIPSPTQLIQSRPLRTITLIWLGWVIIMLGFQTLVTARYEPLRPDYAVSWSQYETGKTSQRGKIYLTEPFMNRQVSWDSEYYLSISIAGYPDTEVNNPRTPEGKISNNYAFFPLYPLIMRVIRHPIEWFTNLNTIASASLAGVLISVVGALFGMVALYDLTVEQLGEQGGIRTAFYFLIFPTSFFLAQVYTEALFAALAFGCLAFVRHRWLFAAGILAALATWTRAVGGLLIIPLALAWLQTLDRTNPAANLNLKTLFGALPILFPVVAYFIWKHFLGHEFQLIEEYWFGRKLFNFEMFKDGTNTAWDSIKSGEIMARRIYFILEFSAVGLAFVSSLFTLRRYPEIALFSLAAVILSVTSGSPQSLIRYMLVIPSMFIFLSHLGRSTAFDRTWTIASILLLSMQVSLFTFDMWVA